MLLKRNLLFILAIIFFGTVGLYAGGGEVRGRIHDLDGKPLKNVAVTAAGTSVKTFTDENGEFVLQVPPATTQLRLQFESAGYYPETLAYTVKDEPAVLEVSLTPRKIVKEEIKVVASRLDIPLVSNPAATSVVGEDTLGSMTRGVAVDEALQGVPGVKIDNQANGERVHMSIRGQGILSEHGLRGIQVLLDNIPLNDPSGFCPDLFDVDWAGVDELNVVRGPVAFLYGGGSAGGVVDIHTREATPTTHGELWTSGGSNGFYKTRAEISGIGHGVGYLFSLSRGAGDGYRQHSAFWGDNLYSRLTFNPTSRWHLNAVLMGTGFFNQNAEGLNLGWLAQDRRMANPDSITFNEYQKTIRFTGGLNGQWAASDKQRVSFTFYTRRTRYDEPVPSSVDHRDLVAPGGSLQYDREGGSGWLKHHFSSGVDTDGQFVDEHLRENLGNAVEGALVAKQSITQSRLAGYVTERIGLGPKWTVLLSLRGDRTSNRLEDKLKVDGVDLSGERIFTRATGRVGATWNPRKEVSLYASWGQGFLPPATEELDSNPAALGGFNKSLVPATSSGEEVGARGSLGKTFFYDVAVFRLDTRNDFERYRLDSRPLETFYRNAGQSRRCGLETSFKWLPASRVTISGAYTYSHFVYTRYDSITYGANLEGNRLPNSPSQQLFASAAFELHRSLFLEVGTQAYSRAYIDATNQTWIDSYGLLNARVSKTWQRRRGSATVFFAGKNLAAKDYIAFTEPDPDGNSYQPGPEREVFGGLQLRF